MKKYCYLLAAIIIITIFIIPVIGVSRYVQFYADDFCRTETFSFQNYLTLIKKWFLNHNGRYVNNLLSNVTMSTKIYYRILIALQFPLILIALTFFFKKISALYSVLISNSQSLYLSSISVIFIISILPSLHQFFFWYAAVTVYLYSFIAFLFFALHVLRFFQNQDINIFLLSLFVFILNGSNELFLGITNFSLFLMLLYSLYRKRGFLSVIIANLVSWCSTILVIFTPGSIARRSLYDYGGNIFGSVKVAFLYGSKYILYDSLKLSFILVVIVIFIFFHRRFQKRPIDTINPPLLALGSYLLILSQYFVIFYAQGLLTVEEGRIGNIVKLTTYVLIIINVINLTGFLGKSIKIKKSYSVFFVPIVLISFLSYILLGNNNYKKLRMDYSANKFEKMENAFEFRQSRIVKEESNTLILEQIPGTYILPSSDKNLKNFRWAADCYKSYVNDKFIKNFESIIFRDNNVRNDGI